MDKIYTAYYLNQVGSGLSEIGPLYSTPRFVQYGRGGIGSFFSGILKRFSPLIQSGLKAIKKQGLKTGTNIIREIGKKPLKDILKEQGKAAVKDLVEKGIHKLEKSQEGSGTSHGFAFKLKKGIKRKSNENNNHLLAVARRNVFKSKSRCKNTQPLHKVIENKSSNNSKERDIFS